MLLAQLDDMLERSEGAVFATGERERLEADRTLVAQTLATLEAHYGPTSTT